MTAKLNIRLNKYLGGTSTEVGAIGQIYAIDDSGERDFDRDRRDLLIPAGYQSKAMTVDLEPGRYMVEAKLPSGDVASRQVQLAEGASFDLDLEASHSPHEWLSWQQYVGNVPPRPEAKPTRRRTRAAPGRGRATTQIERGDDFFASKSFSEHTVRGRGGARPAAPAPPPAKTASTSRPSRSALPTWPTVSFMGHTVDALSGTGAKGADAWRLVADAASAKDPFQVLSAGPVIDVPPWNRDALRQLLAMGPDGPVPDPEQRPKWGNETPRRYLVATQAKGPAELACLPVPWNSPRFGPVAIEVLVRRAPLPGEAMMAMSPRDPEIGAALGFMGTSNLEDARLVFDSAKRLLFGKMINALGAAAGGYVLLATEHGPGEHEWHGWIENLAKWFEWLPDGMIQYGRLRLALRETEADIDAARTALFTAYDRGLPFYSMGLQWLADGLSLLASRDDADARRRLAEVQEVVWRANLTQPFTTIRLRD